MLAAPRLVSASARSKQYFHCASALALPSGAYGEPAGRGATPFGVVGSTAESSDAGICPVITDIDVCSWPGTTVSTPMNSGRFLSALKYSIRGYWNCWIDCQRHMFLLVGEPDGAPCTEPLFTSPCGITPTSSQGVFGMLCVPSGAPGTNG